VFAGLFPDARFPVAKANYGFEKRQRELAKKKKQDEKRRRKLEKPDATPAEPEVAAPPAPVGEV
jgi:hypothetical protein